MEVKGTSVCPYEWPGRRLVGACAHFTLMVMGVFLLLLTFQLANTFFKGMISYDQGGKWNLQLAGLSLFIIVVVALIHLTGKGLTPILSNGLIIGVLLFIILENFVQWTKFEGKVVDTESPSQQLALQRQ